jgi:hypothetical protein
MKDLLLSILIIMVGVSVNLVELPSRSYQIKFIESYDVYSPTLASSALEASEQVREV